MHRTRTHNAHGCPRLAASHDPHPGRGLQGYFEPYSTHLPLDRPLASAAFRRALSRLTEMQSREYLARAGSRREALGAGAL